MVVVHVNIEEILADLKGRKDAWQDGIQRAMAQGGDAIVDLFRHNWLSGRGSDDLGLNIRTGRLYQSIRSLTEVGRGVLRSVVFNTNAPYWEYHELGAGVPKRLYLGESFVEDGQPIYTSEIDFAMGRLAA